MKIVSWNCWMGLCGAKHEAIVVAYPDADIFIIQECRLTDFDVLKSLWKHKSWYGDCVEESNLGIAVFSKTWKVEFTNEFNRKFRYVVPFRIFKDNKSFNLFAVWTKSGKHGLYDYDKNVVSAAKASEYQSLFNEGAVLIGDFNTASNDADNIHIEYYKNLVSGLTGFHDCANDMEIHKATFKGVYRDDFCFFSDSMVKKTKNIKFSVCDEWENTADAVKRWHMGMSDHCPICVEFDL
jgi:exonuclease III